MNILIESAGKSQKEIQSLGDPSHCVENAGVGADLFLFRGLGRNQFFVGDKLVELGLGLWWLGFLLGYLEEC